MSAQEETERLLTVRRIIEERIEKLTEEIEASKHALDHVKNLLLFEEAMRKD